MKSPSDNSLMRSLGAFWGHVRIGATRRLDGSQRVEVRRETVERPAAPGEIPGAEPGSVTLRRTVVEEIEVRPAPGGSGSPDRPRG